MVNNIFLISFQLFFIACICYAMVNDFKHLRIPNWISLALIAGFISYAAFSWESINLTERLIFTSLIFLVTFILFVLNLFGAGDVKFLSAIGLWTPPHQLATLLLLVALLGGVAAIILIVIRYVVNSKLEFEAKNVIIKRVLNFAKKGAMPYGIPIGIAALIIIPKSLQ